MIKLSTEQREAIQAGQARRERLVKEAKRGAKRATNLDRKVYLDTLISGAPGVGKSEHVKRQLSNYNVPFIELTGNTSLFGLMGQLILLHHNKPKGQRMVIVLDDCDFMFEAKNVNMLKHMTNTKIEERTFEYSKKISAGNFTESVKDLLPLYYNEDEGKLTIPCDEFVFMITSNIILPDEISIKDMTGAKKQRAQHLLAIRSRMNPLDIELNKSEKWGWLYDAGINDNALYMLDNEEDKIYLLDWVWQNWNNMKETSVRTIQKMGFEIIDEPEDYKDNWELDYLKY